MKIKKNLPVQTEEIEITLPAYFKTDMRVYRINEDGTADFVQAHDKNIFIIEDTFTDKSEIAGYAPATEQDWKNAMKKFADYWGQFACKHGLTECGYPLPEPEEEKA